MIGYSEYGWHFVGSDTDPVALAAAKQTVESNPELSGGIEFRTQSSSSKILKGILLANEVFDISICNPPFHTSLHAAQAGTRRKWENLGLNPAQTNRNGRGPLLNFGGQAAELSYPGGEAAFVERMIEESMELPTRFFWFSTLISKKETLLGVYDALERAGVADSRTIDMSQGQKKSRIVAWTFLTSRQQQDWRVKRWANAKA